MHPVSLRRGVSGVLAVRRQIRLSIAKGGQTTGLRIAFRQILRTTKSGQYGSKTTFRCQSDQHRFGVLLARFVIPEDDAVEIVRLALAELEFRDTDRLVKLVAVVTV
jgi:hypothetical protein